MADPTPDPSLPQVAAATRIHPPMVDDPSVLDHEPPHVLPPSSSTIADGGGGGGDHDAAIVYRKIDPSSPYYLGSNDNPGNIISAVRFTGANYQEWSRSMRLSLRSRRKFGFIDGRIVKPVNPLFLEDWEAVQSKLVQWIMNTIDPSQAKTIPYFEEAKTLWDMLQRRYTVSNGQRKQELKRELAKLEQTASMSVTEYFGKLEKLWDELANYSPVPAYVCGMAEEFQLKLDEDKMHDILGGIHEERFGHVRSQLLTQDQNPPTLDRAFKAVANEERLQARAGVVKSTPTDVMAFAVNSSVRGNPASNHRPSRILVCTFCGRNGHDEKVCYGKHGFPEWWGARPQARGAQGRGASGGPNRAAGAGGGGAAAPRPRGAEARAAVVEAAEPSGSSHGAPALSSDQFQQLLAMFGTSGMPTFDDRLTGEFVLTSWIIDTGASNHMTGDISLLSDLTDMVDCVVGLPDGSKVVARRFGTVRLSDNLSLHTVFLFPNLTCNLLSVSHLTDDLDCIIHCVKFGCMIQDRRSKMLIGHGERKGGMYYFRRPVKAEACSAVVEKDFGLWHRRLGHPSAKIVQSLSFISSTSSDFLAQPCDACFKAKQTRDCFPLSDNKATAVFELIHCDLWGPYHTVSTCGARYFLTIVDDYSRGVWIFLLKDKTEVSQMFLSFFAMIQTQFNAVVKCVRSDNGTEFFPMKQFFVDHGIIFQTSCVGTPQQNGRVERKHRHILNVARALRFQGGLPVQFWGECILAAGYIINRTPSHVLGFKSPYELLYGVAPTLSELRVFGCLCYVHDQKSKSDKFSSRSRKCVFMGYPFGQKGWKVYDLVTKSFLVSRDVKFFEHVFPYLPSVELYVDSSGAGSVPPPPVLPSLMKRRRRVRQQGPSPLPSLWPRLLSRYRVWLPSLLPWLLSRSRRRFPRWLMVV